MNRAIKKCVGASILSLILLSGCHRAVTNSEKNTPSAIPVIVTPLHSGTMTSYLELSATSAFLFKASVKAPVTGYIENMFINQGDAVEYNHLLFTLKTKEASAIRNDSVNSLQFKGDINVYAAVAGIISAVDHPKGDYVAEGDQLCQVAVPESFVFILDIPFEQNGSVNLNTRCEIVLPDGRSLQGIIKSRFPSMTASSQTERFIIRLSQPVVLPENLIAKISIVKEYQEKAVSLPKSSILTDETMHSFWVMKLINDSTAVKVLVTTGISEKDYVQIKLPVFNDTDLFLSSGNYGLGDTANVKIIKTLSHEQ
jgi:hypothetical protein